MGDEATLLVESVTEVAVKMTVPPVGTADGEVKVVGTALEETVDVNEPQFALPQVVVQLTP